MLQFVKMIRVKGNWRSTNIFTCSSNIFQITSSGELLSGYRWNTHSFALTKKFDVIGSMDRYFRLSGSRQRHSYTSAKSRRVIIDLKQKYENNVIRSFAAFEKMCLLLPAFFPFAFCYMNQLDFQPLLVPETQAKRISINVFANNTLILIGHLVNFFLHFYSQKR